MQELQGRPGWRRTWARPPAERRTLKVLKALAEYLDPSLGDLLEGVELHAFEGLAPFSDATLKQIVRLREVYGLTLTAKDSHRLTEGPNG